MLLAVDIGGTKMALAFVEQNSMKIVADDRVPTGSSFTWQIAEEGMRKFLSAYPQHTAALTGVGMAIPGLIEGDKVLRTIDIPGLEGWVPKNMAEISHLPTKMINDGKAAGIETAYHLENKNSTLITLVVGTGIGSSFLVEGRPLLGKNGWAGEVGACPIGSAGPVDFQAGGKWLLSERMGGITPEEMVALVDQKDAKALEAIKESGKYFGYAIATLINIFNPEKIVVGGGTVRWEGYWQTAYNTAKDLACPDLWDACKLELLTQPHLLVVRGAARMISCHLAQK